MTGNLTSQTISTNRLVLKGEPLNIDKPSGYPYDWSPAKKGNHPHDNRDYQIDLGGGRVPKGRVNVDSRGNPDLKLNLDDPGVYLPWASNSVHGIISHHCLEHIGTGFERLMEECHRILMPGEWLRIIVPLFPSYAAVAEYDHKRYFMEGTFLGFTGSADGAVTMYDGFSEPYNSCRFSIIDEWYSEPVPPHIQWTSQDARELRITLQKQVYS